MDGMKRQSFLYTFIKGTFDLLFLFSLSTATACGKENREDLRDTTVYYPGKHWEEVGNLNEAGWSASLLAEAESYTKELNTEAVVIVHKGRIVKKWGDVDRKLKCHSIRKSFLSALYGIYVQKGAIDIHKSLKELNIDDIQSPLSEEEKQATIEMLLQARSGVYHPALYETAAMAAKRPERFSHKPGTFWYYNNWDFNALGTIFEQETKTSIFDAFKTQIADPIGMRNFDPENDCEYYEGIQSLHAAYLFEMNAMDMARFGLLYARKGKWKDQQVVPSSWVEASLTSYSNAGNNGGYGYLWWIAEDGKHFSGTQAPEGLVTARGSGGHVIAVVPEMDLVVVHRVDTFKRGNKVPYSKFGQLLTRVLKAYQQ